MARSDRDFNAIDKKYQDLIREDMKIRKSRHLKALDINYEVILKMISDFRDIFHPKNECDLEHPDTEIEPMKMDPDILFEIYYAFR